jgi:hypothetical protein
MNINELTLGQAKELANLLNNKEFNKSHPFEKPIHKAKHRE